MSKPKAKKKKTRSPSSSDPVAAYAKAVLSGEIVAGPLVRAACERHLSDLAEGKRRGLVWDLDAAKRAFKFFENVLRLNGGEHEGAPFVLEPWQKFIVGSLFGWKTADGYRRFRIAYIEIGKGNGKSPIAAGVGLYCLVADNEPRAEVYAAATKKDQAMVLFRDAVAMVKQSPALNRQITTSGGEGREWNLAFLRTSSFFRPISADDGQSGPRPHCSLIDEIHEHKDATVVDMLRAGTKGRRQAIIVEITNSGVDRTTVCYQHHEYSERVVKGMAQDDSWFAYVCALDEGDDPLKDDRCWPKANPNLGVSISRKYLEEQAREARGMPSKESIVRRLNFCEWVDAANPWIAGELWRACEADLDYEHFRGRECVAAGLDLSGTRDLTALALVFRGQEPNTYEAMVHFWTPKDTLRDRAKDDRVPYDVWEEQGHISATPGRAVDYRYVADAMGDLQADVGLNRVAFDKYKIAYLEKELDAAGVSLELIPHGQGFYKSTESGLWMPHSLETLEKMIAEGRLTIRKNPCLTWNAASAQTESDNKENRIFTKRKSRGRIDGVVALAMAVGLAEDGQDNSMPDDYEMMIV